MNARHTPGPLALPVRYNGSELTTRSWIDDANGERICTMHECETDADNAAFIVRACNAHDELVRAASTVAALYADGPEENLDPAWADFRAALAKAQGGAP